MDKILCAGAEGGGTDRGHGPFYFIFFKVCIHYYNNNKSLIPLKLIKLWLKIIHQLVMLVDTRREILDMLNYMLWQKRDK